MSRAVGQVAASKDKGTERARNQIDAGPSKLQTSKLAKASTVADVSKVPDGLTSPRASDAIAKPTESTVTSADKS